MKRWVVFVASVLVAGFATTARADRPKTYFDYIERAWACAEIELRAALTYRDGLVLAYPGSLIDVVQSRQGRPQSILLVEELTSKDDKPPVAEGERFFAPLQVLPDHSYWRDNLPATPRHGVLGGRRYIFKGDDIAPAKALTKAYAETLKLDMPERRFRQQDIIVTSLESPLKVLREDAVRRLTTLPVPAKQYEEKTVRRLADYVKGNADPADRAAIVKTMGQAGMTAAIPDLELLAQRDDVVGASALAALDALGQPRKPEVLTALLAAKTPDVRAYGAQKLGALGSTNPDAFGKIQAMLASDDDASVRAAAARGLGASKDPATLDALDKAMLRNDGASRDAAAAIAAIGGDRGAELLKTAVVKGEGEAQTGAVMALVNFGSECKGCAPFLKEQLASNPEKAVRDLISILLELNVRHDH